MIDDRKQAFAAAVQTAVLLLDRVYFGRCVAWMRIVATACSISDEALDKLMAESGKNIADAAYLYVMQFCNDFQAREYPQTVDPSPPSGWPTRENMNKLYEDAETWRRRAEKAEGLVSKESALLDENAKLEKRVSELMCECRRLNERLGEQNAKVVEVTKHLEIKRSHVDQLGVKLHKINMVLNGQ